MSGNRSREKSMGEFWDERARENAMWYINSSLSYARPNPTHFWQSGEDALDATLRAFDLSFDGTERVLEIGCGMGRITRALAQRANQVVGLDVSAEMIARARGALSDVTNLQLILGNGRDLQGLADQSFDVAYSFVTFQHIPDPSITANYIAEMGRVLKPKGWCLFQFSDQPAIHRTDVKAGRTALRTRLARVARRAPRGCADPSWIGSSLSNHRLVAALERGGLRLDRLVGAGTLFCCALARPQGVTHNS